MKKWLELKNNPNLWQKYFIREKIIQAIREFFLKKNFHEVETPLLLPSVIPESHLEVFTTSLLDRRRKKRSMFLSTSPEASIKKLLAAGIGNCFEISKSFRNAETNSSLHIPEFTILEWYRIGATYEEIMDDCERLIIYIHCKIKNHKSKIKNATPDSKLKNLEISYQGKIINLVPPWERLSMNEALQKYAKLSLADITAKSAKKKGEFFPREKIAKIAKKKGYIVEDKNTWEELFNQIFLNEVEPYLGTGGKPTIIYDFPKSLAALARIKPTDPRVAERFELYIGGLELGDCYSELTDHREQKRRFEMEFKKRKLKGKTNIRVDLDFLDALKRGLPQCAGIAMGVDRLVMLFTDASSIDETLLFPI